MLCLEQGKCSVNVDNSHAEWASDVDLGDAKP